MIRENAIDVMNRISENIMISKLVYRSVMKKNKNWLWWFWIYLLLLDSKSIYWQ